MNHIHQTVDYIESIHTYTESYISSAAAYTHRVSDVMADRCTDMPYLHTEYPADPVYTHGVSRSPLRTYTDFQESFQIIVPIARSLSTHTEYPARRVHTWTLCTHTEYPARPVYTHGFSGGVSDRCAVCPVYFK